MKATKNTVVGLTLIFLLSIGALIYWTYSRTAKTPSLRTTVHTKDVQGSYFVPIEVSKFTETALPCVAVDIGGQTFCMELDIGFQGDVSVEDTVLDRVSSKHLLGSKLTYGFRGKQYEVDLYRLPRIEIGAMSFVHPILQVASNAFRQDGKITQPGCISPSHESGRLGWQLFHNVNLFLDLKNAKIAFCDSLNTLKKQRYSIDHFVRVPLFLERGLIELEAQIFENSFVRCVLDTGTTWNILNVVPSEEAIEQKAWDPQNILKSSTCKIGERNFGPVEFRRLPIRIPIQVDAILGMGFLMDHSVFIDFSEKAIYLW